ncbi:uncharacterized protein LOC123315953 [Coccinella septempunctata]|uniref:uncharacterized protein LOC123315953 n=1 Tax=Coccinella septempunctata TaxID=41139 RepID=UPI001D07ED65|nr:uncharacterized protein LOC123315953 [Coccinella septempunctata]
MDRQHRTEQLTQGNIQKLVDKLARAKTRRIFLLKCKQQKLCPNFLKLKTDHITYNCKYLADKYDKLQKKFIFRTINLLITDTTKNINTLEGNIRTILDNKEKDEGEHSRQNLECYINERLNLITTRSVSIHNKKIQKLAQIQGKSENVNNNQTRVENLSTTVLPDFVVKTLNLGPKYSIEIERENEIATFNIITQIENTIEELSKEDQDNIRANVTQALNTHQRQLRSKKQRQNMMKSNFEKTKTFLKAHNDLQVIRADKGNKIVVITKTEYNEKMHEILDDNTTYKQIKRDMTITLEKENNRIIKEWEQKKYITKQDEKTLLTHNSKIPKIYGLPKVHKQNIPLRPIVSCIQSPLYKLSKYMANILSNAINNNEYYIKNSFDLKESLRNVRIQANHRLYSLDVKSLYTNIPTELIKEAIENNWEIIRQHTLIPKEDFIQTIQYITNNSFFQYEKNFYKQIKGVAMGNPLSSTIAQLVMELIEKKIMEKHKTTFFKRYVDDILVITTTTEIQSILNEFNNTHEFLQFTLEEEENNCLNFLDMTLMRKNGNLLTKWHRKEQNTTHILDYNSQHHHSHKKNTAIGYIDRALKLISPILREKTLKEVKELLTKNHYPETLITKLTKQRTHRLYNTQHTKTPTDTTKRIQLPYIQGLSQKISNILKPYNREVVHRPYNQVGNIFRIEPQQRRREILEMIHIQVNNENVVNDKQDTKNLSQIYMPILRRPPIERRRQDNQHSIDP